MTKTNHTEHSGRNCCKCAREGKESFMKGHCNRISQTCEQGGFRRSLRKCLYYNSKPKPLINAVLPFFNSKIEDIAIIASSFNLAVWLQTLHRIEKLAYKDLLVNFIFWIANSIKHTSVFSDFFAGNWRFCLLLG